MKIDPLLLPALVSFECVARHGSFSRAAEEMGHSASALSQSLRSLETRLGVRLLARTTRRVALTDEGARILEGVRDGLASLGGALDALEVRRSRPAGTVRITLPRMTFGRYFAPHLAAFARLHPEVSLEFALEDRLVEALFFLALEVPKDPLLSRHVGPAPTSDVASEAALGYAAEYVRSIWTTEYPVPSRARAKLLAELQMRLLHSLVMQPRDRRTLRRFVDGAARPAIRGWLATLSE